MITNEGPLKEDEVHFLKETRNTESFRIMRKLCAHEYSKLAEMMTSVEDPKSLRLIQGMMKGIKLIYSLLLANADLSYVDGKLVDKNAVEPLQKGKKLNNLKE